ncbi:MAG: SMP-30/gluconolactonase/LRE family protein [Polyangiaceae bacterium]|nr:SMP-30/gluconolactonase/LRE family protein [Polyangiaceae bacterium]
MSPTSSSGSSSPSATASASTTGGVTDGGTEAGTTAWKCPAGPFTGSPIPSGATPARVAGVPPSDSFNNNLNNYTTVEGPVWIGSSLFVSEFLGSPNPPPSRIIEVGSSGVSVAMADAGSNGLAVDGAGVLFGAVHADGSISRFDLDAGTRTPVATSYMGNRFNSPNDLAIRSDGNIYFSDPNYQAPSSQPQSQTRVYRVAPGTNAVSVVDATLTQPNGVTLSLDENTLYVSSNSGIMKYPVMSDGSTGTGTQLSSANVDGMTMDCAGNLYGALINSGGTVVVFAPDGTQIDQGMLKVTGTTQITNVAFGGPDHKTLYITAQGNGSQGQGLFKVDLAFPGMPY